MACAMRVKSWKVLSWLCVHLLLLPTAEDAEIAQWHGKRSGTYAAVCKNQSPVPPSELLAALLAGSSKDVRTRAEFQRTWLRLTSENENCSGAAPASSPSHNGCTILARRADRILLRQVPRAAVEKAGFCTSGFVVGFTGAAERG